MAQDVVVVEKPTVHLLHMVVFTLVVGVIGAVIFPGLLKAFVANTFLNSIILGALVLGMVYAFVLVGRLFPEVNWLNGFRLGLGSTEDPPTMLSPIATILSDASGRTVMSPQTMRSLLDSLASRLDEGRDLLRYLVGLLIFLGLLGTFWGLLQTVTSVGDAIKAMDVSSAQTANMFGELKNGLAKPLEGMGLSFSSSLFGLAASLILGFMDLKTSQAQNRFYLNLEDWLSTFTVVQSGDSATGMPAFLRLDLQSLQKSVDRLGSVMDHRPANGVAAAPDKGTEDLADAVASLVEQMRDEQKTVRQWMQSQQTQQSEIQRILQKLERK